ncbi:MAG: hypothetical protein ACQESP_08275 [Candidatus Muiribacteriota bacterium]
MKKIQTNSFRTQKNFELKNNIVWINDFEKGPLYFLKNKSDFYLFHDLKEYVLKFNPDISVEGVIQLILFKSNFYPYSIFKGILPVRFNKIEKYTKTNSCRDFELILDKIFNSLKKKCGKKPYILLSGGLDSVLVYENLKELDPFAGVSIYMPDQEKDINIALKEYNIKKVFKEKGLDYKYSNLLLNYEFKIPFINAGFADDYFHIQNACKIGASSVVSGVGADEIAGDYDFVKKATSQVEFNWFLKKFVPVSQNFLFSVFDENKVKEVFYNSISYFKFDEMKDRINFILDSFFLNNQLALMKNNNQEDIKRLSPYSVKEFYKGVFSLPGDLIINNNIEKYMIRKYADKSLSKKFYMKPSKDFQVDSSKLLTQESKNIIKNKVKGVFDYNISSGDCLQLIHLYQLCKCLEIGKKFGNNN